MSRKLPHTPNSQIISALRQLWMRSRERGAALKRTGNKCEICGVKASKAQGREVSLEVHHIGGIANWDEIIKAVREHLLADPVNLVPLCKRCHAEQHNFPKHGAEGKAEATTNIGA